MAQTEKDVVIDARIRVGERSIERDVQGDLEFDELSLSDSMQRQPALYAYWAMLSNEADSLVERCAFELDKREAQTKQDTRIGALESNMKLTESMVDEVSRTNERVLEAKAALIELQRDAKTIKVVVRALEHKREMMTTMAYRQREELKAMRTSTVKEE